jgi:hypothetical protein
MTTRAHHLHDEQRTDGDPHYEPPSDQAPFGRVTDAGLRDIGQHLFGLRYDERGQVIDEPHVTAASVRSSARRAVRRPGERAPSE